MSQPHYNTIRLGDPEPLPPGVSISPSGTTEAPHSIRNQDSPPDSQANRKCPSMMMMTITATVHVKGQHCWPEAPLHRYYLRPLHEHMFAITAEVVVKHNDRQVELHDMQDMLRIFYKDVYPTVGKGKDLCVLFGSSSCEMIAAQLCQWLQANGFSVVRTTVAEDADAAATCVVARV